MSANNGDIYDLTSSFTTLANHTHLHNVVIDIDADHTDSYFRDEINIATNPVPQQARRKLTPRKRQSARPITSIQTQIHNLCTPDTEIKKKRANKNKKVHQLLPDEPEEKKTRKKPNLGCCPICFDDFRSKPLSATKCGHVYCTDCIKRVLKNVAHCPQCRTKLKGSAAVHPLYLS